MKKIGIVADNYKLPKFRNELSKESFEFKEYPFTETTMTIQITVTEEAYPESVKKIKKICTQIELHFKRSN